MRPIAATGTDPEPPRCGFQAVTRPSFAVEAGSRRLRLCSNNYACLFRVASAASTFAISRSKVLQRMPLGLAMN